MPGASPARWLIQSKEVMVDRMTQREYNDRKLEISFGRKEGDIGMAKEVLFLVEEAVEGGYIARALGHSIFTEADTWDELREAVRDAVHCHFDPDEQPELIRLHAVREEVVAA